MKKSRIDQLTSQIQKVFDVRDPWIVPRSRPPFDKHVMDLFTVTSVVDEQVELRRFINDRVYVAELQEACVRRHVRRGDTFLMAVIRREGKWRVWHMSPPYF